MGTNPVKLMPWTLGALDTFQKYNVFLFHQQRRIYENIAARIPAGSEVLEGGCGIGIGTALMEHRCDSEFIGTDLMTENLVVARELYPWLNFELWDVRRLFRRKMDIVVAVEVIEHVENPASVLQNFMETATDTLWFSTPNGNGKPRPPENPFHVCEYTREEMVRFITEAAIRASITPSIGVLDWNTFDDAMDDSDPLVYRVRL